MTRFKNKLPQSEVEKWSYKGSLSVRGVDVTKSKDCIWVKGITVSGDAPKGFVRLYEYNRDGRIRRNNPESWPLYIAKTGQKWYPIESITEYLLNRLGTAFGIKMADSKLSMINGQLRFLSRYFLHKKKESLVHGAEIFAGYLEDQAFVESVEKANLSRLLFTLRFVEKAITKAFPSEKEPIMKQLVKLLLYDAMVGNNDRHFYNWAVIQPFDKCHKARFSPVYDTARGLFWNVPDEKLKMRVRQKDVSRYVMKYCEDSRPKLGWEDVKDINHFRLVEEIFKNEFYISKDEMRSLFDDGMLFAMKTIINQEFFRLLSEVRIFMINKCLDYRHQKIKEILK